MIIQTNFVSALAEKCLQEIKKSTNSSEKKTPDLRKLVVKVGSNTFTFSGNSIMQIPDHKNWTCDGKSIMVTDPLVFASGMESMMDHFVVLTPHTPKVQELRM